MIVYNYVEERDRPSSVLAPCLPPQTSLEPASRELETTSPTLFQSSTCQTTMAVLSKDLSPGPALYAWLVRNLLPKLGERWTFAALTSLYHDVFVFIPFNAALFAADRLGLFEASRIQPGKHPERTLIKEALRDLFVGHFLVNPVLAGLVVWPLFKNRMVSLSESVKTFPSWKEFLLHFLVFIAVEDTIFYWTHRLLHESKWLYRNIHKQHHRFKTNVGIASEWANPVESLLGNTLPTLIGPYLMKSHPYTMFSWIAYRVLETINAHSGYNLKWVPFNWFPAVLGGADRHDFHHSHNVGAYGSQTKFWDWICGTDKAYWEWRRGKGASVQEDKTD